MYKFTDNLYTPFFEQAQEDNIGIKSDLFTFSHPDDTIWKYYYDDREDSETKDMWWAYRPKKGEKGEMKILLDTGVSQGFKDTIDKLNNEFKKSARYKESDPQPQTKDNEQNTKSDENSTKEPQEKKDEEPSGVFPDEAPEAINKKIIELIKEKKIKIVRQDDKTGEIRNLFVTYTGKAPKSKTREILKKYFSEAGYVDSPPIDDQITQQSTKEQPVIRFVKKDGENFEQVAKDNSLKTFFCFYYSGQLKDKWASKKWKFKGSDISPEELTKIKDIVNALTWKEKLDLPKEQSQQESYLLKDFKEFKLQK